MSEDGEDQAGWLGGVAGCSDSELSVDGGHTPGQQGGWRSGEPGGSIGATGFIVASSSLRHVPREGHVSHLWPRDCRHCSIGGVHPPVSLSGLVV